MYCAKEADGRLLRNLLVLRIIQMIHRSELFSSFSRDPLSWRRPRHSFAGVSRRSANRELFLILAPLRFREVTVAAI
jgi:hypothetical protein